jgi:enterochelin esterase family protein
MTVSLRRSLVLGLLAAPVFAQAPATPPPPPPAPVVSPEVLPDRRVAFRLRAPNAKAVLLSREGVAAPQAMEKDEGGVWSLTVGPLEPDYYGYSFVVDGVTLMDPSNAVHKPNLVWRASEVHVPGTGLPWEVGTAPRGSLHRHFYHSKVVGDDRDFHVYTPAGYDPAAKTPYPVLYLLHGYSDDASGWTAVGRAHVILDNLIAEGKAKPMLVVMTLGYGAPEIITRGPAGMGDLALRQRNVEKFREALLDEVIPQVERAYRAAPDRESRAIAGLSMGGGQSLFTGLRGLDTFAWVGAFSSAIPENPPTTFASLDAAAAARLRLLWIACGSDDFLIQPNRQFHAFLDERKVRHTYVESTGGHTWMNWRRYLASFAPLLFR